MEKYTIGADFGSDSVRAIIVRVSDGITIGESVCSYPRWGRGKFKHACESVFRQHPKDYLESFTSCIRSLIEGVSKNVRDNIIGLGIDTTGSTPAPVYEDGTLLALTPEYCEEESAMFWLWKDHSAIKEAEEVNQAFEHGSGGEINYLKFQGRYSAEWYWAKILHAIRLVPKLREDAYFWVEHCDWMVAVLTGNKNPNSMYHSACAAGHKAYWNSYWNGLPDYDTLEKIDPYLRLVAERYGKKPQAADACAGTLCSEWAEKLGLPENVKIAGSQFDAHAGAVGAGIEEKTLISILGTSAVDMLVATSQTIKNKNISRFGGQADESILPGYVGIETGQAAFGDIFAWYKNILLWPFQNLVFNGALGKTAISNQDAYKKEVIFDNSVESIGGTLTKAADSILFMLQNEAEKLPDEPFPIALDWFNGRRYPDTDDSQRSAISGLSLGVTAPILYRSLVFAAVCGLKRICDGYEKEGIEINHVKAVGGISTKSPYVMQMMADVLGKDIAILDNDQTCALGAAINAAVASSYYEDISNASKHMAAKEIKIFHPDSRKKDFYSEKYEQYLRLASCIQDIGS